MLRTSLRTARRNARPGTSERFLSSNAQDFIEEAQYQPGQSYVGTFLSSNAQDFIEENTVTTGKANADRSFLSSNAQDFIEDRRRTAVWTGRANS